MTDQQALLASPGLEGQPVKGVYFFPGEAGSRTTPLFTTHPLLEDDKHWNSDHFTRGRVMERMAQAHVNTVVMSYWSNMPQWSPMDLDASSVSGVLDAVQGRRLVIMPAIEGGADRSNPSTAQWEFSADFPRPTSASPPAPGLIDRIGQLVAIFRGRMHLWARLYDSTGGWRYAVNIIHACSNIPGTTDESFARGFADVAAEVEAIYHIRVGFTLDLIGGAHAYVASPDAAASWLTRQPAVLAAQGFASEVFSGKVRQGPPGGKPYDNNINNLTHLADWKKQALLDWADRGLPVILDVLNGFDGRIVWATFGSGFWGDNMDYTDDRWRNWMSCLKGPLVRGISFDTWNGYTEGYAATPSAEHCSIVYSWLTDLLEPDPRNSSHMHYVNGAATHRVYGAICGKWLELGADRGFGIPTTGEQPSARGRVSFFTDGVAPKAIYWSTGTGAHEVHGIIARTYWDVSGDAGDLGLPTSDEEATDWGAVSFFQGGRIEWRHGDTRGNIIRP
jgi:hypothetical protein